MKLAARATSLLLPPLVFLAIVLTIWQTVTTAWEIKAYLVSSPLHVWNAASEHSGDLFHATLLTAAGALGGFGLSLIVGTLLALIFSQSRSLQRSIYPYAIFLQTVPIVAIAPVVIMWFGNGFGGVVAVSFILSLFPILTNVTAGLTTVDANLLELFEIHNASRWQLLLKLRMPGAIAYLVTAAKISCGLSVIGAIVGEISAGFGSQSYGLGYLITMATGKLDTAYAFAAVICSTLLSIAIFATVSLLGSAITHHWHLQPTRSDQHTA